MTRSLQHNQAAQYSELWLVGTQKHHSCRPETYNALKIKPDRPIGVVRMDGKLEKSDGGNYKKLPEMVAAIEFLAGKRTILDYFSQPVAKGRDATFC